MCVVCTALKCECIIMYKCVDVYIVSNSRERGNLNKKATIVNARTIDCSVDFSFKEKMGLWIMY